MFYLSEPGVAVTWTMSYRCENQKVWLFFSNFAG